MFASDHVVFYSGLVGSLHISRIRGALAVLEHVDGILNSFKSSVIRLTLMFSPGSAYGIRIWGHQLGQSG